MRSMLKRMLYSPERNSLAGTAPTGSLLPESFPRAGGHSGRRHTLQGVKDENGSSMGRGQKAISKLPTIVLRASVLLSCMAGLANVAHAQSAAKWDKRGAEAESRQDYDTALEDYHKALIKKPTDLAYKAHYEHMRFLASVAHIDRGRVLRQNGDLNGAL